MNLSSPHPVTTFSAAPSTSTAGSTAAPTASERVLAAELEARGEAHDALSMMVSSVVRMVQAGRTRDSRWKDC
ncbi:hypothetical protein [Cyanobium sp. CH-040]|uniref:hypothetical protein n=1 Tax=Cyanobium sp. CH-040 TaxID=2823708 RepID=UPI0020CF4934|nr:hypothetical protein [Cyanobium sp. CH-040]MCP9926520.1 hypothetical protein [Cyanobium sp. CH-040]